MCGFDSCYPCIKLTSLTILKLSKLKPKGAYAINKARKKHKVLPKLSTKLSSAISKKSKGLSKIKSVNVALRSSSGHSILSGPVVNSKYRKSYESDQFFDKSLNFSRSLLHVFLKLHDTSYAFRGHGDNVIRTSASKPLFKLISVLDSTAKFHSLTDHSKSQVVIGSNVKNYQVYLNATILKRAWSLNLHEVSRTQESAVAISYDSHVPLLLFSRILKLRSNKSLSADLRFIVNDLNPPKWPHIKTTSVLARSILLLKKIRDTKRFLSAISRFSLVKSSRSSSKKAKTYRLKLAKKTSKKPAHKAKLFSSLSKNLNHRASKKPLTTYLNRLLFNTTKSLNLVGRQNLATIVPSLFVKNSNPDISLLSTYSQSAQLIRVANDLECGSKSKTTNIMPAIGLTSSKKGQFKPALTRELNFYPNMSPWILDSVVRLIESCSGKKAVIQHSMNVEHMVNADDRIAYKQLIVRMAYYERTLGHRFFMEEALHIMHLSFKYHDVKLFASWLKAIITRISFWKTRSIFRFLKYVFNNHYRYIFDSLSVKGIKIRLKGKISAAGNSRKRTILFRSGKNSYSSVNVKCIHNFSTITTFTGVLGFQVWLFY